MKTRKKIAKKQASKNEETPKYFPAKGEYGDSLKSAERTVFR